MNFKNWFLNEAENSVINNIVYHGTDKKFDQFSYQKSTRTVLFSQFEVESKGFFFAESPHDALVFGRNIAACYITMKNPLLDPRRDKHLGIDRLDPTKEMHLLKILGAMIGKDKYGSYIDLGVARHWITPQKYEFPHQWIYLAIESDGLNWDCLDNPEVVKRMIGLGYDGTFVAEPDSHVGRSIFVPNSNQIKIVKWINGQQEEWGDKDDYGTKKVNGLSNFYSLTNHL